MSRRILKHLHHRWAFILIATLTVISARAETITFSTHVAPLIYNNCATCHRDGEAAPFSLMNFTDAKKHAKQIADVTARRIMPPWKAEHGGATFLGQHFERRDIDPVPAMVIIRRNIVVNARFHAALDRAI